MNDYNQEVKFAISQNIFNFDEIFDYTSTPNETIFQMYYDFCRENLNIQSSKLSIKPNCFIFYNNTSVNAKAGRKSDYYFIAINSGLIIWCIENIAKNENLNKYLEKHYPEITKFFDNDISILSMQIATNFTYYHECAHLIQFSKTYKEITLQEREENTVQTNLKSNHLLEINADSYASLAIASHILQYLDKSFGKDISKEKAISSLKIFSACLLSYITSFSANNEEIYFEEKSHPHPFIRIFNIMLNILNYLNQSKYFKTLDININISEIFKNIIDFYITLEKENVFTTGFESTFNNAFSLQNKIVEYLSSLIEFNETDYFDALEKWNDVFIKQSQE